MKIQVENNIYVESDEKQFILKEYTGSFDKKGNELAKTLGYFGSVNQSLKHLVKLNIMKSDATNVKELIADIERIEKRIEKLVRI